MTRQLSPAPLLIRLWQVYMPLPSPSLFSLRIKMQVTLGPISSGWVGLLGDQMGLEPLAFPSQVGVISLVPWVSKWGGHAIATAVPGHGCDGKMRGEARNRGSQESHIQVGLNAPSGVPIPPSWVGCFYLCTNFFTYLKNSISLFLKKKKKKKNTFI